MDIDALMWRFVLLPRRRFGRLDWLMRRLSSKRWTSSRTRSLLMLLLMLLMLLLLVLLLVLLGLLVLLMLMLLMLLLLVLLLVLLGRLSTV